MLPPIVGLRCLLLFVTAIALVPVPNELLSRFSNADPFVLPSLTIVICSLSTATLAGVSFMRLLLHARLVRLKANASDVGCGSLPGSNKNFTLSPHAEHRHGVGKYWFTVVKW